MHPAVTYGLLALCAVAFGAGIRLDGERARARFPRAARMAFLLEIGAVVGVWLTLRPGRGVDGSAALEASVAARQPLLLEFYSNW